MKLKAILQDGKKLKIVIALGIVGILLIFLPTFLPKGEKTPTVAPSTEPVSLSNEEYEERYREAVEALVQHISGAGRAEVVVTLESGVEYVYETEENTTNDTQNETEKSYSQKSSLERTTLLVEDESGRKKPLLRKTLAPKIRGVVVVCEGGGNIQVVERVTEAVTTALGVSSARVCVTELSAHVQTDAGAGEPAGQ